MSARFSLACVSILLACSSTKTPEPAGPPAEVTFPAGFLWGSATAAFQIEKGDSNTDWAVWAKTPGKIKNNDDPDQGPDALAHIDDDIKALKDSGQNAYRFSVSWGRLYPTRESFDTNTPDAAGLAAYESLLDKLKAAGITPMVTLHHFVTPSWLADPAKPNELQGWERPEMTDLFVELAKRLATRWAGKVDWWCTINEPLNVALGGYVQGSFPPGVLLAMDRTFKVVRAEARAHAKAYDAIKAADTVDADGDGKPSLVGAAMHQRTFHPLDPEDADDKVATDHLRYIWNFWFLNAVVKGDWDEDLDENYTGAKDGRALPELKGKMDYVGINYYSDTLVSARRGVVIPVVNAAVYQDHMPTDRPKTDFAWDIYAEGFGTVLDEAKTYGLPVVITENGLADAADKNRPRFLTEHLYQLGWAIQRGVDVRGYFHWSLIDNFEWASGFCPRFGLYTYDRSTGARTPRASVQTYKRIIQSSKVTRADVESAPPYSPPTICQ